MIYLILGILVLILSFVVALYTLIRDAKHENGVSVNSTKPEFESHESSEPLHAPATGSDTISQAMTKPSSATTQEVGNELDSELLKSEPGETFTQTESDDRVWWKDLEGDGGAIQEEMSDDDKSIEKIQAHIQAMIANKAEPKPADELVSEPETTLFKQREDRVKIGEVSLSDLRKKAA